MNVHVVHGEDSWLLLSGDACAAYSPQLLVRLGHHHFPCCNLLFYQTQDLQTLSLVSHPPSTSHCCLSLFCPALCHVLVHLTFSRTPSAVCSRACPWGTSRRVMKATGKVVFLLSAPMSGLWQMGAAVTGEILLISCNLSPLHAQSHCGAGAFPATYGWTAGGGGGHLLQHIF